MGQRAHNEALHSEALNRNRAAYFIALLLALTVLPAYSSAQSFATGADNDSVINVYGDGTGVTKIIFWNVSSNSWTAETSTNDTGLSGARTYQRVCTAPNRKEAVILSQNDSATNTAMPSLAIQIFNGTGIGSSRTFDNLSATVTKAIDCAYEELSGRAMIVWSRSFLSNTLNYTIWNGTAFSQSGNPVDVAPSSLENYVRLVPKSGSNEMILATHELDNINTLNYATAQVWNGTAWGNAINLTTQSGTSGDDGKSRPVDCAYESVSGTARCFYSNGTNKMAVRSWNGSAWSEPEPAQFTIIGESQPFWIDARPNPTSNEILVFWAGRLNLTALRWNGTTIDTQTYGFNTSAESPNDREENIDVAYRHFTDNSTNTEAVFVWASGDSIANPEYSVWNGTNWTEERAAQANVGGFLVHHVQLTTNINGKAGGDGYWLFMTAKDQADDINNQRYNSTNWSANAEVETEASSPTEPNVWIEWLRIDNTTPVFRSAGTNETDNAINASSIINLNATVRDNFQLDCWWIETNETGKFTNYTDGTRFNCTTIKSTPFQYANITWTNTSITVATGGVAYNFCANDTRNNRACSSRREFLVIQAGAAALTTLKANLTADAANITITTSQTALVKGSCETNNTVSGISISLQNSTNNASYTNITASVNYPRANVSDYSISSLNGNSTQILFNVSSNTSGTFYLRVQCKASNTSPAEANSTINKGTSVILNVLPAPTQFSLKANHTAGAANIPITTNQTTLFAITCETNGTVADISAVLQNSTDNSSFTNITAGPSFPLANASSYSIPSLSGNSTSFLFNVSSNQSGAFYLRAQCRATNTNPREANSTINQGTSIILTVTAPAAAEPGCTSGQATPTILCGGSCVTLNLAFAIGSDKNNTVHTDSSDCNALNASSSGFGSLDNKFISGHGSNAVLGIVFAGTNFYHAYFDTAYSSSAYLIQMKQSAEGNKFLVTFTKGTSTTLDGVVSQNRDKIPSLTFGDVVRAARASFPVHIRLEYDDIDLNNRVRWDGPVRISIKNQGIVSGLANITLSLLSGG